jgi:hypothetical protein
MLKGSVKAMCSNARSGSSVGLAHSAAKADTGPPATARRRRLRRPPRPRRAWRPSALKPWKTCSPLKARPPSAQRGCRAARAALGRQRRDVQPRAHAPEVVDAVDHLARGEGGSGSTTRRRPRTRAPRPAPRRHDRLGREAPAGVQQQADAQAAQRRGSAGSPQASGCHGRLIASRASGRLSTASASAASATLRVIGPATRPGNGGWIGTRPRLGLKPTTPHHAAGSRIEPPMSVPRCSGRSRRRSRGRAGAAAARVEGQVPGVARQRMEARQARRQHAVVGHGGLAQRSPRRPRAGARPAARRRRGHQLGGGGAQRHRHAARGDVLLQRDGHAVQWPAAGRAASAPGCRGPAPAARRRRSPRWHAGAAPSARRERSPRAPPPAATPRPGRTGASSSTALRRCRLIRPARGSGGVTAGRGLDVLGQVAHRGALHLAPQPAAPAEGPADGTERLARPAPEAESVAMAADQPLASNSNSASMMLCTMLPVAEKR